MGGGEDRAQQVVHRNVAVEGDDEPLDVVAGADVGPPVVEQVSRAGRLTAAALGHRFLQPTCRQLLHRRKQQVVLVVHVKVQIGLQRGRAVAARPVGGARVGLRFGRAGKRGRPIHNEYSSGY